MNLEHLVAGKVIVVTGASRGIGAGLATAFGAAGARLGLCARGPLRPANADTITAQLDVADEGAVAGFARSVVERLGPIAMWINNAGVLEPIAAAADLDGDDLRRHLEINVVGLWAGAKAFLRHRREVGPGGVLINISSGAGRSPYAGWSAYCAGKAAVDRMTECIALEERAAGTRAHAVAPGIVDTAMQELIRATPATRFPMVDKFLALKADDRFSSPAWIAARLAELAFDPAHRTDDVLVSLPSEKPL